MLENIGPVMLDVLGTELTCEEEQLLKHPLVGGVILFSRNFSTVQQVTNLCQNIRQARQGSILIAVDHEGGRVQRFREGFTRLPSMGSIGKLYESSPSDGIAMAYTTGWLMASELLAIGVDFSFAPVLDLDKGLNQVVGDRSFHRQSNIVIALAEAYISGMKNAGMSATGKHFPGHGNVASDSHTAMPIDTRQFTTILSDDMQPFMRLQHLLDAIMPAHILFPEVDSKAVGFSEYWLQSVLRTQLEFSGIIFSDDLNMDGAGFGGDYAARAALALQAGCDMILICNNRPAALTILQSLENLTTTKQSGDTNKFARLQGKFSYNMDQLKTLNEWQDKRELLQRNLICSSTTQ